MSCSAQAQIDHHIDEKKLTKKINKLWSFMRAGKNENLLQLETSSMHTWLRKKCKFLAKPEWFAIMDK